MRSFMRFRKVVRIGACVGWRTLIPFVAAAAVFGQMAPVHSKGVPTDWSHRHLVFSNPGTEAEAIENGAHERWLKIANEPRYAMQQVQRQAQSAEDADLSRFKPPAPKKKQKSLDWGMGLGPGNIPNNTFPAKWSFSTTTANCASDFVVFPTGSPGSSSQATIVAYNNMYSGCGGTVPSVYWQYNTGSSGAVTLSPVPTWDGSQVAFVQSTGIVLLKWKASASLVSLSNTPAASYRNCTAPCMTVLTFNNGGSDTYSSPFYDYQNDILYVGDGTGYLHKFTGVFNGTPTEAGSPWPVSVETPAALTSPVLDPVSARIFVGSTNGHLYAVNSSTGAVVGTSSQLDFEYGLVDAPLVDSSAGKVYAFAGDDGSSSSSCNDGRGNTGCSGVFQFPVTFTSGSGTETQVGYGHLTLYSGAFDNTYFTSSNSSSPTGHLYVCGQTDSNEPQTLNQISITSNVMGAQTASSYLVGRGGLCSPVTEFYNSSVSNDYLFLSSEDAYQGCPGGGCVFGFNVTNGIPDSAEFDTVSGGTGGIIVDNSVGSGTLAGASEIYYITLNNSGTCATSGSGLCGVQDSQTSLYVDWSQFRFALDHDAFNQYETALSPSTVGSLDLAWSYTTNSSVSSSPAVANGVVYIGSLNGGVYAVNATTGALLWSYVTSGSIASSPAVANGTVYIGSEDYSVYALNATTGARVWSYATGSYVYPSPAVANGIVYVGSNDDKVYALNANTGALVWSYTTGGVVQSSPAVANGIVYVGSADNKVYALNAATGAKIWSYTTGNGVYSSPAIANGTVYVGSYDDKIYALNAATGALVWSYTTGNVVYSSPAVANGVVYVGSLDDKIYALNAATGALVWSYTTGNTVYSSPAVANGVVYVGSQDFKLYGLNASTGALLWSYATADSVYPSPAVANGMVYVASWDEKIYAFALP
jgi:outer membrane protein assembly factor BamB